MSKKAFTLAEVLITLSILGVVAAISIPNIVQNYQKRLTVTKLQVVYSELEKAANNIRFSTGCEQISCLDTSSITTANFINWAGFNGYKYHFIWYKPCQFDNVGTNSCNTTGSQNTFYANDSKQIGYSIRYDKDKSKQIIVQVMMKTKFKDWSNLYIGKDIFYFMIHDNFIVSPIGNYDNWFPTPMESSSNEKIEKYCSKQRIDLSGYSCAAKIIKDGWKITYW